MSSASKRSLALEEVAAPGPLKASLSQSLEDGQTGDLRPVESDLHLITHAAKDASSIGRPVANASAHCSAGLKFFALRRCIPLRREAVQHAARTHVERLSKLFLTNHGCKFSYKSMNRTICDML